MRRPVALASGLASLGLLLAGVVGGLALAAEGDSVTVSVSPTRLEFVGAGGLASTQEVRVSVTGGGAGTVALAMQDGVVDDAGRWQDAPYGSTPDSLRGILTIDPKTFAYVPDGTTQTFVARLHVEATAVDRPLVGSLVAVLAPEGEPGATVVQQAGVAIRVLAAPADEAIAALPASAFDLRIGELAVGVGSSYSPLGAIAPDLPGVVGRGPLEVTAEVTNAGRIFLDAHVTYTFTRLSPLAVLSERFGGRPLIVLNQAPRYLLPGQRYDDATTTRPGEGDEVERLDAAPFIGLLRVTAQATGTVAGRSVTSEVRTRTVLALPWAESLVALAALVVLRSSKRSRGRRARRRAAEPRDVTTQTAPTPPTRQPSRREPKVAASRGGFAEWWIARGRETERRMADAAGERDAGPPLARPGLRPNTPPERPARSGRR